MRAPQEGAFYGQNHKAVDDAAFGLIALFLDYESTAVCGAFGCVCIEIARGS